jgi:hypothetical protein
MAKTTRSIASSGFFSLLEEYTTGINFGQSCRIWSPVAVYRCFWMAYSVLCPSLTNSFVANHLPRSNKGSPEHLHTSMDQLSSQHRGWWTKQDEFWASALEAPSQFEPNFVGDYRQLFVLKSNLKSR